MKRLKLCWILFILSLVLAAIFAVLLIVPEMKGDIIFRIGPWCGLISQLLLAAVLFAEIRKINKGQKD